MKKVFFLFIGIFFLVACKGTKSVSQTEQNDSIAVKPTTLTIAVVNVDSILLNYKFAIQAQNSLLKKGEDARLSLSTKARKLNSEMEDFQKKMDNNAFLSRDRAEQEAQRLQKAQADLQDHQQKLAYDISNEQQNLEMQLQDSIDLAIKEINKNKKFSLILSTSSMNNNVLFMEDEYNITQEIVDFLNKRCK